MCKFVILTIGDMGCLKSPGGFNYSVQQCVHLILPTSNMLIITQCSMLHMWWFAASGYNIICLTVVSVEMWAKT